MVGVSSLAPAHRGYQYQDVISAIALVDMLLLRTSETLVDRKLFRGDLFDDLTIIGNASRQRIQIKHSSDPEAILKPSVFSSDARGVQLDLLLQAVLADRDTFPEAADKSTYRLIFTERFPASGELADVLHPASLPNVLALSELGAEVRQFDGSELWALKGRPAADNSIANTLWNLRDVTEEDLNWACARLHVEVSAPQFSGDLLAPAAAEEVLLDRVRHEVGAGSFPNTHLSPVEVAAGLILAAQSARSGIGDISAENLIRRTRLRTDFGAVTAATPVVADRAVTRDAVIRELTRQIEEQSRSGGICVVAGPPGQGKSWASEQVKSYLEAGNWLVAEHYCFLGEADSDRDDRVLLDAIIGSLIARLADADGKFVVDNTPRFTADRTTLQQSLRAATRDGTRKVALIVDGLDHISRVRRSHRASNPSLVVCEALALLELPPHVVLVILSQPGDHLAPFRGAVRAELPSMNRGELEDLSARLLGDLARNVDSFPRFLDALVNRSGGNALYATYLILESSRRDVARYPTRADLIASLPPFDGTLKNYYEYLYAELDAEGWLVAEELAVANFAMTREELEQLRSPSRVEAALRVLSPVLREQVGSGIRFYHESFGRFIRDRLADHPREVDDLFRTISDWLGARGMFNDQRAFRWLIPTLVEQGRHAEVVNLIHDEFVQAATANSFSARAISANLALASESAAILGDWPGIVRLIQMAGAAQTFDFDRFETVVEFTDVQASFVAPQDIADRLSDGDRLVVTGRQGVLRCAALDAAGAVAPWAECLAAYERERESDNVHRGTADDQEVALAVLRGRFRMVPPAQAASKLRWKRIAKYLDRISAPVSAVVDLIADVVGIEYVVSLARHSQVGGALLLELAERSPKDRATVLDLIKNERYDISGSAHRALMFGLKPSEVWPNVAKLRKRLLKLTRKVVLGPSSSRPRELEEWVDLCAYAARLDPLGLASAEAVAQGEGWYRDWLLFVLELVRVEHADHGRSELALNALRILEREKNPFRGTPRASDLYSAHEVIARTIVRALRLVAPGHWAEALEILGRVSRATTTIAMGFAGGPLVGDVLASILQEVSPAQARESVRSHLQSQIDEAGADVLYPEIAGYHLRLARLELLDGAVERAGLHWQSGIALLTSYGSHKDSTIYELIEPLEDLLELDRAAVRTALQRLQSVTLAVENHTDGRGTSRVHADWWREVARADPSWLIDLALPELASNVNASFWTLQRAVEEVWSFHHAHADPRIAAAVRVAVEIALTDSDPEDLKWYLEAGLLREPGGERLLRALIARFDERATSSVYTNASEILDAAEQLVARANAAVSATDLPRVSKVHPSRPAQKQDDRWVQSQARASSTTITAWTLSNCVAPGLPGVYDAIQAIRQLRGASEGRRLGPNDYQNTIGYRLVELVELGRVGDAEQALVDIADALPYGENPQLLASLSEGFHRLGQGALSATAGVLAWTRARQRGGWGTFGAEVNLEYLGKAFATDGAVAREVLGREVARAVTSSNSFGPSQALIKAASAGALPWGAGPADAAMRCWNAACDVVDQRTPRFSGSDLPEHQYVPTQGDDLSQAEVDRCVGAVALARVCVPSRESKRRALIAISDLLEHRPRSVLRDLEAFMERVSDPVTQYGVLSAVLAIDGIADGLQGALSALAQSDLLAVRSLARSHVRDVPDLPVAAPSGELIAALRNADWEPRQEPGAESVVEEFLASRLAASASLVPELERAVAARLSDEKAAATWRKRTTSQLDSLATRVRTRWPDAVLSVEEEAERALQTLAGEERIARIVVGDPIAQPSEWEAVLGARLAPSTAVALQIERTRMPRPNVPGAPQPTDSSWIDDADPSRKFIRHEEAFGKLVIDGWICVGFMEGREFQGERYDADGSISMTVGGVYAGKPHSQDVPFVRGALQWWRTAGKYQPFPSYPFPLIAINREASRSTGLGAPHTILVPTPALRRALDLRPADRLFSMVDGEGETVARLVVWRAEYEASDYELTYPCIQGQAVVIRPDCVAKLAAAIPFDLSFSVLRSLQVSTHD